MALDWAVCSHKWMANAQTKMPTKIFILGATLLRPSLGSRLTGNSRHYTPSLPPHLWHYLHTRKALQILKNILAERVSALSQVAHFWNGGRMEWVLHTYYYGIVSFMIDISFLKKTLLFSKTALSAFIGKGRPKITHICMILRNSLRD